MTETRHALASPRGRIVALSLILAGLGCTEPREPAGTVSEQNDPPAAIKEPKGPASWRATERVAVKPEDWTNIDPARFVVSPGGTRYAYVVRRKDGEAVVVDGKEGPRFESVGGLTFSDNDRHFAYGAFQTTKDGYLYHAVVDGKVLRNLPFIGSQGRIVVTSKGRLFIVTSVGVLIDGKKPEPATGFTVSQDGSTYVYLSQRGDDRWAVVRNGVRGPEFEGTGGDDAPKLTLSPDGEHYAFALNRAGRWFVIVDGKEREAKADKGDILVRRPAFSADFTRWATSATTGTLGGRWRVVVDGKAREVSDVVARGHLAHGRFVPAVDFSPDGKTVAYQITNIATFWVVIDGTDRKEHKKYNWVSSNLVFSRDGRLAYAARAKSPTFVVLDGKEGTEYDKLLFRKGTGDHEAEIRFSPNGLHLAYVALKNSRWFVVLDGQERKDYDAIYAIRFTPTNTLAYLARSGDTVYWVEETLK